MFACVQSFDKVTTISENGKNLNHEERWYSNCHDKFLAAWIFETCC